MVPVLGVMLNPAGYTKSGFLSGAAVTRWEYLRSQPGVVLHYLRLAVWPDALCLDYGWPVATSAGAIAWPLLALAALAGLTLWSIRRCPPVGLLAGWFFLCLAPTSSLVPIVDLAFEHRMYLPLAALAVAAVLLVYEGLELLSRRRRAGPALGRWSFAALIGILVCLLGGARSCATAITATTWRSGKPRPTGPPPTGAPGRNMEKSCANRAWPCRPSTSCKRPTA